MRLSATHSCRWDAKRKRDDVANVKCRGSRKNRHDDDAMIFSYKMHDWQERHGRVYSMWQARRLHLLSPVGLGSWEGAPGAPASCSATATATTIVEILHAQSS